jgi:plasmid maintenance system antidote protein VapI
MNVNTKIKHPENLEVKARLTHGDMIELARKLGRSPNHIRAIMSGHRLMKPYVADAVAAMFNERRAALKKVKRAIGRDQIS